VFKIQKYNELA